MEKKKIVFLYAELATYFLACIEKLLLSADLELHIVRFPVNKEAPFHFDFSDKIKIYERTDYSDQQLVGLISSIKPSIIVCSGWTDRGYMKVCKAFKKKSVTVLALDNHWRGDIKQRIAKLISPFYLKTRFSKCWVPGKMQYEYAQQLSFKTEDILSGFYSCDYDLFHDQYLANKTNKQEHFPKRFIFVGRYYSFKGVQDLWKAFVDLNAEEPNDWELWCLGTGELEPVVHEKIKHFGFVQPSDLPKYIKDTGVFILPSHFEPWGVVVHEFAAAGFPIICSDEVGASSAFVEDNFNGYIYSAGNITQLKEIFKKVILLNNKELSQMGDISVEKAKKITPSIWAEKLSLLLKNKN
jgi:glycosyltransferase involved in cell wall biosynthesis